MLAPVLAAQGVCAQNAYPVRPVRIMVSFLPGGTPDILARSLAVKLTRGAGSAGGDRQPAGTPKAVVSRLNAEIVKALATLDLRARLAAEGAVPDASSPEEFAAFIRAEIPRWGGP